MAEYLNVERSALSRELSKMKRDGLISYKKNYFVIF
jgi:Mn-dependent DtxR family transcriptional regulator